MCPGFRRCTHYRALVPLLPLPADGAPLLAMNEPLRRHQLQPEPEPLDSDRLRSDSHGSVPGSGDRLRIRHDRRPLIVTAVVTALICGVIAVAQSGSGKDTAAASSLPTSLSALPPASSVAGAVPLGASGSGSANAAGAAVEAAVAAMPTGGAIALAAAATLVTTTLDPAADDLDGGEGTTSDSCTMDKLSAALGDTGPAVSCLQAALTTAGFFTGAVTGQFDSDTYGAVRQLQESRSLFVDGVVGRETALALGIWPDEDSLVAHTPPPAAGAVDLLGYPLSYVATSGSDTPPLPADSGSGKRLVYDRAGQRVWAVDANERVIRSWLVSGSKYSNEVPGTHHVYSKSEKSTAWNGKAILPHMVRYLKTRIGNIGFHGIPRHVSDGSRYQTDQELGQRLSGGCQRQADLDADFVWDFADIGTTVVVL